MNHPVITTRIYLFATALILMFSACLTNGNADRISNDYCIAWKYIQRSRALYKKDRIVPPYVYAAGLTGRYIVVKQHPLHNDGSFNTDSTCYYIIEITKSKYQDKPVYGPLNESKYDSLSNVLGITDVPFDWEYPLGRHWKMM
jgi:hypothetical protein